MDNIKTNTMIAVLNGPVIDEFNTKLTYIRRIFEYYEFLGITKANGDKPLWYNQTFDYLYDCDNYDLEHKDNILHDMCDAFSKSSTRAEGSRP